MLPDSTRDVRAIAKGLSPMGHAPSFTSPPLVSDLRRLTACAELNTTNTRMMVNR